MIVTLDDDDLRWAFKLTVERHSMSIGRGDRDTRGVGANGEKPGMFDLFGLHDSSCMAVSIATGASWISNGNHGDIDFESESGPIMVVACEAVPTEISVSLRRLEKAALVISVVRQADQRRFRIDGLAFKSDMLRSASKSKAKCFDPSTGSYVEAVRVNRSVFKFKDPWSKAIFSHNETVVPSLFTDQRNGSRNPRRITLEELGENEVVLNHQGLEAAFLSSATKRFGLGFANGIDGGAHPFGPDSVESHLLGAVGERVLIKKNFAFRSPPNTMKKMDFDNNVWLCTRRKGSYGLIVQPEDVKLPGYASRRNVLVIQESVRVMRVVGYITGYDILRLIESGLAPLTDPTKQKRKPAHFIEQKYLSPIQHLIDIVKNENNDKKIAI